MHSYLRLGLGIHFLCGDQNKQLDINPQHSLGVINMKILPTTRIRALRSALLLTVALLPGLASAIPAAVEGRILSVTAADASGGATINVMGMNIYIPGAVFAGGLVTTPSATLVSPSQLSDTNLAGRVETGFIGGTAIINGDSTALGGFIASDVFAEPAENVVIGLVSRPDGGAACEILLEGVPVVFSDDLHMPFTTAINGSGFDIVPCTVRDGGMAAVEGYFGELDGSLHIFLLESDDADIVPNNSGTTTIARASCDRGKVEVRGSSTLVSGSAVVYDNDSGVQLGATTLIYDAVTDTSAYRYRDAIDGDTCPANVRSESWDDNATNGSGGGASSFTTAPVDIK